MRIYIHIVKVKLATVVKSDQKAPFSIATTPRCRGGCNFFSLDCSTLPLSLTLYCWVLSKEVSSTIFKVFGMTQPGIEPRFPGPLANTIPTRTMKYHHHHDVRQAQRSLTLSLYVSLSFIAFGRSSGLHPVSSHSCCKKCSSWSFCFWLVICGGPQEHITYDLVFASPTVSCMSGSSSLDSFRDRW